MRIEKGRNPAAREPDKQFSINILSRLPGSFLHDIGRHLAGFSRPNCTASLLS
jgi:hypothetical protein